MSSGGRDGIDHAQRLNRVDCVSLDGVRLAAELERVSPGFHAEVMRGRPHLFSSTVVFVGEAQLRAMAALIAAVERVVALPAYQAHVLAWAPASARHRSAAHGAFMGYDFHLDAHGVPQLIEINTNAGGGLLNALLARAQRACCDDVAALLPADPTGMAPEQAFLDMFRAEFRAAFAAADAADAAADATGATGVALRRPASADFPRCIAIVDEAPQHQYLYPEFVLFQRLFERAGMQALICDPQELACRDGALWHGATRIDLVYNRLTDFALDTPAAAALRAAWLTDAAVITPHPRAHALHADKRNLAVLGDDTLLAAWGVDAATRATLAAGIPRTERVVAANADDLWARRRQLFFKPAAGYGSKAAYRGDKITRRVFDAVLAGDYIAQALVPPSSRRIGAQGEAAGVVANLAAEVAAANAVRAVDPLTTPVAVAQSSATELKVDLRNYAYAGQVQLVAARLYQGQTTNFRTPGGGFAPVLAVPPTMAGRHAAASAAAATDTTPTVTVPT